MRIIRNRMTLLIYQTLLLEFGENAVQTIFEESTLSIDEKKVSKSAFFDMLVYQPPLPIPFDDVLAFYRRTEKYLIQQQYPLAKFIDQLRLLQVKSYMITSAQELLASIQPILHQAFQHENLYLLMFDFLTLVHPQQISDTSFTRIGHTLEDNHGVGCIEQIYDRNNPRRYLYDPIAWKTFILQGSPMVIGLNPFDKVTLAAEVRTVKDVLQDIPHDIVDGHLVIEGEVYGDATTFTAYCESNPLYEKAYSPEGYRGIHITKNYYREDQKKVLLWDGCFYGAPTTLFVCHYTKQKAQTEKILQSLIAQVSDPKVINEQHDALFLTKHQEFVTSLQEQIHVTYYPEHAKISISGTYLTRHFPAQLLFFLCDQHLTTGKEKFLYQDIISDPSFSLDPKKPNLHVRISRLQAKLAECCPQLHIKATERGAFKFWCDMPIALAVVE